MGWGNAAKKAKANVNEQAKRDGIIKVTGRLQSLFPRLASKDKAALNKLIVSVQRATRDNQRKQAVNQFKKAASAAALRLVKSAAKGAIKAMLSIAVVLCLASSAQAGILDLDPFLDGVKKASKQSRYGLAVNLKGTTKGVGYIPLAWDKKRGYWDIGLGINAKKWDNGSIGAGIGLNLVNIGHDLLKNIFKDRVGLLPIPGLYIGPVISTPSFDNISARWDYREKIDFYLTYALFGPKK